MATAAPDHARAEAALAQPTPTLAGTLDALRASLPEWWPVYAGLGWAQTAEMAKQLD